MQLWTASLRPPVYRCTTRLASRLPGVTQQCARSPPSQRRSYGTALHTIQTDKDFTTNSIPSHEKDRSSSDPFKNTVIDGEISTPPDVASDMQQHTSSPLPETACTSVGGGGQGRRTKRIRTFRGGNTKHFNPQSPRRSLLGPVRLVYRRNVQRNIRPSLQPLPGSNLSQQTLKLHSWKKQIDRIYQDFKNGKKSYGGSGVPTLDTRVFEWVENAMERLHNDQLALQPYVWGQVAIWMLTHDRNSMLRFLKITHAQPYLPAEYVVDCFDFLVRSWHHSDDPDRIEQLHQLADLFCVLSDRNGAEGLSVFNPSIRLLIYHCPYEQLLRLYRAIQLHKVSTHWWTYLHFTTYFLRNNHFELALEALLDAKNADANLQSYAFRSNCSALLRKSSEQPEGLRVCLRLVSELVHMGVQLDRPIFDIIMLNAVEVGDLKTALSVYHSMVDSGLKPAESTFAVLLKGCRSNIDDAELLNNTIHDAIGNVKVRESQLVATEILYCLTLHHSKHNPSMAINTLTQAYAQLFDLRPLEKLGLPISKMEQEYDAFMVPSQHAVNFMIKLCIEQTLLHRPYTEGLLPLYERFRDLMENRDLDLAPLATTDSTLNLFLMAFIQRPSGLLHAARVVRDMQRLSALPKPTVQTFSIFMHGFTRHGKTELGEQVLSYMRSQNMEPTLVTWNTLIGGYAQAQNEDAVLGALSRARASGMAWDDWTHKSLARLRNRQKLEEELRKTRLERSLDFSAELKSGLQVRVGTEEDGDASRSSPQSAKELIGRVVGPYNPM